MAARSPRTVGVTAAALFLGISPQTLNYRARTHRIPVFRYKPLLFRIPDLIEARSRTQVRDNRGRHVADHTALIQEAAAL